MSVCQSGFLVHPHDFRDRFSFLKKRVALSTSHLPASVSEGSWSCHELVLASWPKSLLKVCFTGVLRTEVFVLMCWKL